MIISGAAEPEVLGIGCVCEKRISRADHRVSFALGTNLFWNLDLEHESSTFVDSLEFRFRLSFALD